MVEHDLAPVLRFGDPEAPVPVARIDQGKYWCLLLLFLVLVPIFETVITGIEHRCSLKLEMIMLIEKNGLTQIADLYRFALIKERIKKQFVFGEEK